MEHLAKMDQLKPTLRKQPSMELQQKNLAQQHVKRET
jgi:hypothetical protein